MKKFVILYLSLVGCFFANSQNTDLPSPSANLQTLPAGSYVIPMDNVLQTDSTIGNGNFNLNSYGLIVHLLNKKVKIKWVIKAGKAKDGIDFTGNARMIKPVYSPIASPRDFIAGPFVIFAADTSGVAALIDSFYITAGLSVNKRPKVFGLTVSQPNVDIRYDLTGFIPKAAILTDGGKAAIHIGYMTACNITTANYTTGVGNDLLTKCFTFASEPHNGNTGPAVDATISAIKMFVQYGGNFLAQCSAVVNYENNPLGRFQTTTGVTVQNSPIGTTLTYPNPDLGFSQFHGSFDGSKNGSVMNWSIPGGINNEHDHATGTGIYTSSIGASVSKVKSGTGGLVFYIGNHEFKTSDGMIAINGIRMYMNAFLTPVSMNNNCSLGETLLNPLPVKLLSFNASLDKTIVNLAWSTSEEYNISHFVIERSFDGVSYNDAGTLFAYGNSNEIKNYSFADNIAGAPSSVIYYRLRMTDADGKFSYSPVRMIRPGFNNKEAGVFIYPNPVRDELRITIPGNWQNKKVTIQIFTFNGQMIKQTEYANSSQTESININKLAPGFYLLKASCNGETAQQKIIKQ